MAINGIKIKKDKRDFEYKLIQVDHMKKTSK